MLRLENIAVSLGKGTQLERSVLQNLSLDIAKGEFITIIGGNGAGKSTLFNVVSGFLKPDSGRVVIDGEDVSDSKQSSRMRWIAKVMQDPRVGTMENMTLFENMAFAFKRGQKRGWIPFANAKRRKLFKEKLGLLEMGLENRLDELVGNLSGGQRQALSLIMAIIADSKILLLDEMTAALDPKTAEIVMELAHKIVREEKRTCMMITHNMAHAIKYGDRLLVLNEGRWIKEYGLLEKQQLNLAEVYHSHPQTLNFDSAIQSH